MSTVSRAEVLQVISYNDEVREYILFIDDYVNFEAGQFLQLTLENVTASANWPDSRTFSIASYLNDEKTIRIVIKKAGEYTSKIFEELEVGKSCYIKYAYGDFLLPFFDDETPIHCIAGGTGVAPFLSFMEYLEKEGNIERLFLYYSVRKKHEFVNYSNIKATLNSNSFFYCTRGEAEWAENRHIEINDILNNVKDIADEHFYICGSKAFILTFKEALEEKGALNIYLDEWD